MQPQAMSLTERDYSPIELDTINWRKNRDRQETTPLQVEPVAPFAPSETTLSERFAERHKHYLRYVAQSNRWYHYDGGCWRPESTLMAFDLAKRVCIEASRACGIPNAKTALESAKTRSNVVS